MGIYFATGFEYAIATISSSHMVATAASSPAISSAQAKSGTYSMRINPTTTGTRYITTSSWTGTGRPITTDSLANVYTSFYFRYATAPSSNAEPILAFYNTSAVIKLEVRLHSSGTLRVYDNPNLAGSAIFESSALSADTWYKIDVYCGTGTTGNYELRVNDVSLVATTADLTAANSRSPRFGKTVNRNSQTVDYYYDNIVCSNTGFIDGDFDIVRVAPIGAGNYSDLTGSYTDVDEVPFSMSDYISSATINHQSTFDLESAATAGITGTILGVVPQIFAHEPASSSGNTSLLFRNGTTDTLLSGFSLGTTQQMFQQIYETNPDTSAAWTLSDIDNMEVGIKLNASSEARCGAVHAEVIFQPSSSGSGLLYFMEPLTGGFNTMRGQL